jgi:hypothetical protein
MAQVIEFYVPAHFKKRAMWVPHEKRGKVIAFRTDLDEITLGAEHQPVKDALLSILLPRSRAERREEQFFQYCCSQKQTLAASDIKPYREELA